MRTTVALAVCCISLGCGIARADCPSGPDCTQTVPPLQSATGALSVVTDLPNVPIKLWAATSAACSEPTAEVQALSPLVVRDLTPGTYCLSVDAGLTRRIEVHGGATTVLEWDLMRPFEQRKFRFRKSGLKWLSKHCFHPNDDEREDAGLGRDCTNAGWVFETKRAKAHEPSSDEESDHSPSAWYEAGCTLGDSAGCYIRGLLGLESTQPRESARRYFKRACDLGLKNGCLVVSYLPTVGPVTTLSDPRPSIELVDADRNEPERGYFFIDGEFAMNPWHDVSAYTGTLGVTLRARPSGNRGFGAAVRIAVGILEHGAVDFDTGARDRHFASVIAISDVAQWYFSDSFHIGIGPSFQFFGTKPQLGTIAWAASVGLSIGDFEIDLGARLMGVPATRITDVNSKDDTFVRTQSIVTPFVQLGVGL
jgi:hypothetical protein